MANASLSGRVALLQEGRIFIFDNPEQALALATALVAAADYAASLPQS